MIPKVVMSPGNQYGRSFKGLVSYISNDAPDPQTGEMSDGRVGFAYVRNLPSDKPSIAWKVMAATAMNREQIKEAAGIRKGGRPDKGEVMHLILSWDESERETLTEKQMTEAADETLAYLGLSEHQVYGREHDEDHKNPHMHLAINRVHPETGKIAKDWRSYTDLSRWALDYERSRGKVLVQGREDNWAAREQGLELPRQPSKTRVQYEAEQATSDSDALRERNAKHQAEREALIRQNTELRRRGEDFRKKAFELHQKKVQLAHEAAERRRAETKARIERSFLREHQRVLEAQREEREAFEANQQSLTGRLRNRWKYTDWRRVDPDTGRLSFTRFFNAWSEPGFPKAQMDQQHAQETEALHDTRRRLHQRREERFAQQTRQASRELRREHGERLLAFDEAQQKIRDRLGAEQQRLDRERRRLVKIGRLAKAARDQVKPEDRPTAQSRKTFGDLAADRGRQGEGDQAAAKPGAAAPNLSKARSRGGAGAGSDQPAKKTRIRRPRKPRGQAKQDTPKTKAPEQEIDLDDWRVDRGERDEHER